MADFKIKSAVGTGNKTLLQSQDQTGSNYAIQVGDAGVATINSLVLKPGSAPSTPTEGSMYYDNTSEIVYVYNGKAWIPLSDSTKGGIITSYTDGSDTYVVHTFFLLLLNTN